MTAGDVIAKLKEHFAGNAWAFLEQVADATGARQHRWADAVAMSVWPSRGYDIHGIEVKVSRYDWQKELAQPAKSAAVQQYCNRWWIATSDESIIKAGELPPTWGWMVIAKRGMRVIREAPPLEAKPISVEFVASILRNVQKADESEVERRIEKARREAYEKGGNQYRERYAELAKSIEAFQKASGIMIHSWNGDKIGEAVETFYRMKDRTREISSALKACGDIQAMLESVQKLTDFPKATSDVS